MQWRALTRRSFVPGLNFKIFCVLILYSCEMLKENVCLKMLFAVLCYVFVNTIFQPWIIEKFTLEGLIDIIFYFIYFSPFATKGGWVIDDKGWSAMRQKQWSCFLQLSPLAECFIMKICVQQHLPHFSNKMAGPFLLLWLWGVESNILLLLL